MAYFVDGLRRRIVVALGLTPVMMSGPAGCAARVLDDSDGFGEGGAEDGDDDDGYGSTTASPTTGSSISGSGEGTVGGSEDDGTEDDGPPPPPPPTQTCWPTDDWLEWELWLPPGADGQCLCDEECEAIALAQWDEENCCGSCWYSFGEVQCAEALGDQCHYIVTMFEEGCGKGRPLLVDGRARVASRCDRDEWAQAPSRPRTDGLPPEHRHALAERWTAAALAEHASVASFARFVLDLTALGAPPSLLTDAIAAMQDEIRHAQLAFALASAYADRPLGPGPLPVEGVTAGGDAEAIVRAAVREGCVEETLAAAEVELAAHRATDPAVRAALAVIAEDEARHAVLAWRFVDWAVRRDPRLAAAVRDEFRRAQQAAAGEGAVVEELLPPEIAAAHGVLTPQPRHELRACCLRDTIGPCAEAMLRDQSACPWRPFG